MRHALDLRLAHTSSRPVVLGQAWVEFTSVEDGFRITFPIQPQVQKTTYTTQSGYTLPAKVYSVTSGPQRFALTVVDFRTFNSKPSPRCARRSPTPASGGAHGVIGEGEWRNESAARRCSAEYVHQTRRKITKSRETGRTWSTA